MLCYGSPRQNEECFNRGIQQVIRGIFLFCRPTDWEGLSKETDARRLCVWSRRRRRLQEGKPGAGGAKEFTWTVERGKFRLRGRVCGTGLGEGGPRRAKQDVGRDGARLGLQSLWGSCCQAGVCPRGSPAALLAEGTRPWPLWAQDPAFSEAGHDTPLASVHPASACPPSPSTFLVTQMVKRLSTMRETRVRALGGEDLLEKEMATHSHILAWKIPWTEEPGGQRSMELQRVGHN